MTRQVLLLIFLLCTVANIVFSQDIEANPSLQFAEKASRPIHYQDAKTIANPLKRYEDSLVYMIDSVYQTEDYKGRNEGNNAMIRIMKGMLRLTGSYEYTFDSLAQKINIMQPVSKSFKLYNWEVLNEDGTSRYYGVVQKPDGKIIPIIDVNQDLKAKAEDSILSNRRWFGALYYRIMEQSIDGRKVYFLFGLNQSSKLSARKVIECMQIVGDSIAVFGAPVFQSYTRRTPTACNRFILEYQKDSHVSLNWDPEQQMIVFDHLESTIGDRNKRYTYSSDGTYDGLRWNGKMWLLQQKVIAISNDQSGNTENEGKEDIKKELAAPIMEIEGAKPINKKKK